MWTADIRMKWRCDHRNCDRDLNNRKVSPKHVFGASTRFEHMASALALQCSANWATKTHTFGAGQFIEFMLRTRERNETHVKDIWVKHMWNICFIPFTGTMNSINWPAPNVWVFIAPLVEHCSANAEAMALNPVEAPKTFFGLYFAIA